MNALKGIVFIMTLAIAVLMTLIVYGLYQKSQDPDFKFIDLGDDGEAAPTSADAPEGTVPPTGTAVTAPRPFGDITLNLPADATVLSANASANALTLVLKTPDGTEIWVVDPTSGEVLGRVLTQPAKSP